MILHLYRKTGRSTQDCPFNLENFCVVCWRSLSMDIACTTFVQLMKFQRSTPQMTPKIVEMNAQG